MLLDHCYCPYICTILKYVHHFANIAKWNVKHLTYTICTFEDTNWESIDISKWNTSYLAETRDMFGACNKKRLY